MLTVNRRSLREKRILNARQVLNHLNLDAMLLTAWDNIQYVTDAKLYKSMDLYSDYYAAVLRSDGQPIFVGVIPGAGVPEGVEIFEGWEPCSRFFPGQLDQQAEGWAKIFERLLGRLGLLESRIGLDYMPFAMYEKLKKRVTSATFLPCLDQLLIVRAVKNEEEIKLARNAAKVVDAAIEAGFKAIKPGVTERQVFSKIAEKLFELGSEMLPWSAVCRGPRASRETMYPTLSERRLRRGENLRIDVGAVADGYHSDIMRTNTYVQAPDPKNKAVYESLLAIYEQTLKAIKPGAKVSSVYDAAVESYKEAGYRDDSLWTKHGSLGHGVGLKALEFPIIDSKEELGQLDMELKPGMILCPELTIGYKTFSSVDDTQAFFGLEDVTLVTETGYELLTRVSKDLKR